MPATEETDEKQKCEDPVQLAQQLFGNPGSYFRYLYPGREHGANDPRS